MQIMLLNPFFFKFGTNTSFCHSLDKGLPPNRVRLPDRHSRCSPRGPREKEVLVLDKRENAKSNKNHYVLQLNHNNLSVVDGPNDPMVVLIIKIKFARIIAILINIM